jgi:prolyl oligopeptidase
LGITRFIEEKIISTRSIDLHAKVFVLTLFLLGCDGKTDEEPILYLSTRKIDHVDVYHEQQVKDPYRWLEDDNSVETGEWVAGQNRITQNYLTDIPFRNKIKKRLETLYDYERVSAPFREGNFEYFYKNTGLQNHSVLYRSTTGSNAPPQIFLDPNSFSEDGTVALRGVSFTKDGSLAGYMITEGGSDWRKIVVINRGAFWFVG